LSIPNNLGDIIIRQLIPGVKLIGDGVNILGEHRIQVAQPKDGSIAGFR